MKDWDQNSLPLYGCLTGLELPEAQIDVLPGISLRSVYVDTFGATMMAFAPPPSAEGHHPEPWAPVRGGFMFEGRTQVEVTDTAALDGLQASAVCWLIAAVLRLRVSTPIRLAVIGNMPFDDMGGRWKEVIAFAFESAPHQIGRFTDSRVKATEEEIEWLRLMLPVAAQLYHEERFFRSFSVYEQAQWAPMPEIGAVLVWTAIEMLFDLSAARDKARAISRTVSEYVAASRPDRDRAYQVISDLYQKRGRTVHAGRSMDVYDVAQSFRLASIAFQQVLIDGALPPSLQEMVH